MLRKIFALFLALGVCFLCSCAEEIPEVMDTTIFDHTTTDDTTTAETTIAEQTEETTAWEPNLHAVWQHTPHYPDSFAENPEIPINPEDYDIKVTVEPSVFSASEVPEYIRVTANNLTGKTCECSANVFLEKLYNNVYPDEPPSLEHFEFSRYFSHAWVRVPFANLDKISWGTSARADLPWRLTTEKCLRDGYEFTPGRYRFVVFTAVGTHYGYFEVTE